MIRISVSSLFYKLVSLKFMDYRENKLQRADRENYILTFFMNYSFNNLLLNLIFNMLYLLKHFKDRHFLQR